MEARAGGYGGPVVNVANPDGPLDSVSTNVLLCGSSRMASRWWVLLASLRVKKETIQAVEGRGISGRNVARSSFAHIIATLGAGTKCQPSGEILQQSKHRTRPGQTEASREWSLEWAQLGARYDEEESPRVGYILWRNNCSAANELPVSSLLLSQCAHQDSSDVANV